MDSFAYADSFDETSGRYRGLRYGQIIFVTAHEGMLVKSELAGKQAEADAVSAGTQSATSGALTSNEGAQAPGQAMQPTGGKAPEPAKPKRFHGSVSLDPDRVGRDAGRVADEVISHINGLMGAKVKVTLDIEAVIPNGAPDNVVRTVTENSRTLKFDSQGFETE
jgi:hypothetical protein